MESRKYMHIGFFMTKNIWGFLLLCFAGLGFISCTGCVSTPESKAPVEDKMFQGWISCTSKSECFEMELSVPESILNETKSMCAEGGRFSTGAQCKLENTVGYCEGQPISEEMLNTYLTNLEKKAERKLTEKEKDGLSKMRMQDSAFYMSSKYKLYLSKENFTKERAEEFCGQKILRFVPAS